MLIRTEKFKNPHFTNKDRDSAVKRNNERAEYSQKSVKKERA